jgi:phosphatidylinositol alpha-1,6-mannosyltransferase
MDASERYKGHDGVIAALSTLVANGHDVEYVVVGEGDDVARLKRLAIEAGVEGRVIFLGAVFSERLVEAYRMADLFVMPSTGEGFGIAFLEAMACGTPALGLATAGAKDALADGELGVAVEDAELADALGCLLQSPRPNPHALSAATRARFGRQAFAGNVCEAMCRLFQTRLHLPITASKA